MLDRISWRLRLVIGSTADLIIKMAKFVRSCFDCCFGWMRKDRWIRDDDDIPTAETEPLLYGRNAIRDSYGGYTPPIGTPSESWRNPRIRTNRFRRRWNSSIIPNTSGCAGLEPIEETNYVAPLSSVENRYLNIMEETDASMIYIPSTIIPFTTPRPCPSAKRDQALRMNHYQFTLQKVPRTIIPSFKILLTDIDEKFNKPFDDGALISADDIQLMDDALNEITSAMDDFGFQTKDEIVVDYPPKCQTSPIDIENHGIVVVDDT